MALRQRVRLWQDPHDHLHSGGCSLPLDRPIVPERSRPQVLLRPTGVSWGQVHGPNNLLLWRIRRPGLATGVRLDYGRDALECRQYDVRLRPRDFAQ
ncbi:hypothetical protein TIFTF001_012356 [Ficus carica]|uniref:Uncharacterized protein n=1 Tax=Ficus carica TaxID=3494 RepID=A0AA88AFS0_FICCA|nr:hypothetical protein TIFTF001_012356 [Ficus carica]